MELTTAVKLHAASLRRKNRSPRTIDFYATWLHALDNFNQHATLEEITLTQLREWIDSLIDRGLSPGTVRGAAMTAKVFFRWCTREGLIEKNVAERLELPQKRKRAPDVLTTADLLTLINDVTRHSKHRARDTALLCFWSETGCRIGELAELTPQNVRLQDGYAVVLGKGNKQRWVFFGDASKVSLADWLTVRPTTTPTLYGLTKSGLRQVLRRLSARTGLRLHPHKMRRSAATLRAARGISARALQDSFGWERLETANAYVAAAETQAQAQRSNPLDGINIHPTTT